MTAKTLHSSTPEAKHRQQNATLNRAGEEKPVGKSKPRPNSREADCTRVSRSVSPSKRDVQQPSRDKGASSEIARPVTPRRGKPEHVHKDDKGRKQVNRSASPRKHDIESKRDKSGSSENVRTGSPSKRANREYSHNDDKDDKQVSRSTSPSKRDTQCKRDKVSSTQNPVSSSRKANREYDHNPNHGATSRHVSRSKSPTKRTVHAKETKALSGASKIPETSGEKQLGEESRMRLRSTRDAPFADVIRTTSQSEGTKQTKEICIEFVAVLSESEKATRRTKAAQLAAQKKRGGAETGSIFRSCAKFVEQGTGIDLAGIGSVVTDQILAIPSAMEMAGKTLGDLAFTLLGEEGTETDDSQGPEALGRKRGVREKGDMVSTGEEGVIQDRSGTVAWRLYAYEGDEEAEEAVELEAMENQKRSWWRSRKPVTLASKKP